MKMAKPSERDIDAAGDLMALLHQIDRGDYPNIDEDADVPDWFDENNYEHLRAFYDAIKATLDKGPGYPGRVIGGMCYVIMYDKNEIVDPASDTLDLHPKIVKALEAVDAPAEQAAAVRAAEWMPIATVPMDGTEVLLYLPAPYNRVVKARWFDVWENWIEGEFPDPQDEYCGIGSRLPTHWTHLPAAPSTTTSNDTGALGDTGGAK